MSESEQSDSTYQGSSSQNYSSEETNETEKIQASLTNQQLDEMWNQLQQMNQKKQEKKQYFQIDEKPKSEAVPITKIDSSLFNPLSSRANLAKISGNQVVNYASKIMKYAPKIVTIHETRKFWQMYKSQMSQGQLEVLGQYVQSQNSFIRKQKFLSDVKKRQK
ncbi:hypothetical protein SS50377_22426 [Spironucleus salmonicida]|uniref:BCNT-C domain-containing protein n=1 Tax=Spironucleus salmonicida TaxID=348837 RepID=V6LCV3_9EUKA|nr:hypothetical protein SS50377_22426 [Spironucleus salmonicida]|eukprot:EST42083.1 hypothetical protein SS50377_18390 [Spironucleus salmonicida]